MLILKTPIYQTEQIRKIEKLADQHGIKGSDLMRQAGKAAFDYMLRKWPQAKNILILCGNGNNGGDGYTLGLFALERGLSVSIYPLGDFDDMHGDALEARRLSQEAGATFITDKSHFNHYDLIIDAICGIGLKHKLKKEIVSLISQISQISAPVFAIDIPTGVNADTGCIEGEALRANATITFIGLKLGLLTGSGAGFCGELVVNDLQLPEEIFSHVLPVAEKITYSTLALHYLTPRGRDWHKGKSGHVLIIGGDNGMTGAPCLAGLGALRVGAGLVTIATRASWVGLLNLAYPELMTHAIESQSDLTPLLKRADVIVVGPGLGQSDWGKKVWETIKKQSQLPMVVDADALNLLALNPKSSDHWILTPHPGEAARLLNVTSNDIQEDRLMAVKNLQKQYGGNVVLKGAGSLVCSPNALVGVSDRGNPGMSTAGMGDVLSGVIGGLLAQGIPITDAARLGVIMHALAGDSAAKDGERGMIATDLLPHLRRLSNFSAAF